MRDQVAKPRYNGTCSCGSDWPFDLSNCAIAAISRPRQAVCLLSALLPAGYFPPPPSIGDLTDTSDICTIGSIRAGEKPVGSLTIEEEVMGRRREAARRERGRFSVFSFQNYDPPCGERGVAKLFAENFVNPCGRRHCGEGREEYFNNLFYWWPTGRWRLLWAATPSG